MLNGQRRKVLGWESAQARWLAGGGVLLESPEARRAARAGRPRQLNTHDACLCCQGVLTDKTLQDDPHRHGPR